MGLEIGLLAGLAAIRLLYEGVRTPALDTAFYYLDWFLAGMALAVLSAALDHRPARPRAVVALERHPNLCWLAAFGVYCTFAFRLDHHPPTFSDHLAEGLFALLVVSPAVFVGSGQGLVRAVLNNRLLAWLGLISYGLYLWHVPILLKLSQSTLVTRSPFGTLCTLTAVTLLITVACASFSYYLLEQPLLRFKSARGRPRANRAGGRGLMSAPGGLLMSPSEPRHQSDYPALPPSPPPARTGNLVITSGRFAGNKPMIAGGRSR